MASSYGVFLGLDVGKTGHHAVGLEPAEKRPHDGPLPNSEPTLQALFDKLATHGPLLVVVDQPATIGALPVTVARTCGHQVAYLPGLALRRIADLYPGTAKTDARDTFIIAADTVLPRLADSLKTVLAQQNTVASEVEEILDAHPLAGIPTPMPGIGIRTAARILLEIGDTSAFTSSAHLAVYAGIAPVTRTSSSSIKDEHPAHTSNRKLKRAFFLVAFAAHQQGLLRPQENRGQETQHRPHLPRSTPLRRAIRHAVQPHPLPAPPTHDHSGCGLTTT